MMEVSVFVQETQYLVSGSYRPPTVVNSFTGQREMQPEIRARMRFRVVSNLGKPRARHHQARGVDGAGLQRFDRRSIYRMSFTKVVGMNNDQLCAGRIPQVIRQILRADFI